MWSLGVTIFETVNLKLPFEGSTALEYKKNTLDHNVKIPDSDPNFPFFTKIIPKLLVWDPAQWLTSK